MKKSLFPRLALMAVVVALVSACSEKKFEYTNVIPANASTVVSINMKSLVDKAGLNDKENKEAQQKLTDAMKSGMNAATFQQVEMIMKDPKKSGIDVSAPLYVFNTETFPHYCNCKSQQRGRPARAAGNIRERESLSAPGKWRWLSVHANG